MNRTALIKAAATALILCVAVRLCAAGTYFEHPKGAISGGLRWDAAPRMFGGNERSLDGGLRYSMQGGSFQAFRDYIPWNSVPTVEAFQQAVEQAFAAWEAPDPVTGLATDLRFVADFGTAVVGTGEFGTANPNGAEIDILAVDAEISGVKAAVDFGTVNTAVTLTSGTAAYIGSSAISGADITFNINSGSVYSIDSFRRLLAHEIGHTLGLGDVDVNDQGEQFVDDNYDGTSSETALATLTNSWGLSVDAINPAASPLSIYSVARSDPGIDSPGVDILMESTGLGISPGNNVFNLFPLRNDDYGMRQFLYPSLNFAFPPGDFNRDGTVDAADYVTWRDGLGTTFAESDYGVWRKYFGSSSPLAVVVPFSTSVSEPAALSSMIAIFVTVVTFPRRRSWPIRQKRIKNQWRRFDGLRQIPTRIAIRLTSGNRPERPRTGSVAFHDQSSSQGRDAEERLCRRAPARGRAMSFPLPAPA